MHFPQMQVIASYGAELLDWLNTYTFPEETKFRDAQHGRRIARLFFDELVRHGTTTVAAYCSVHKAVGRGLLRRGACAQHADDRRQGDDGPQRAGRRCATRRRSAMTTRKALIDEWHGKGRQLYAITPRFAITSTPEQMEMAGALAREYPDLHMQTHLSENHAEIAFTQRALSRGRATTPTSTSTTACSGRRALFGHCIHLSEREADALSRQRLGRGVLPDLEPVPRLRPVRLPALPDARRSRCGSRSRPMSAAAPTIRCCARMDEGYKVIALHGEKLNPLRVLLADDARQRRGAVARGQDRHAGSRARTPTSSCSTRAATPAMRCAWRRSSTLAEELFLLQTLGDDRSIAEVYVAGKPAKSALAA